MIRLTAAPPAPREPKATQNGTDAEASAASTAIAALRWRLRRQSTLEDPAVRRELRELEQQLAAHFEQDGCAPGRHRSPGDHPPGQPVSDRAGDTEDPAPGSDLATARPAPELITTRGH
jgi:hypothetical protein